MADDIVRDPKTNQIIYPGFQRGPGLHNASSYQVSAIPYLSGNLIAPAAGFVEIKFPTVTSWVKIDNLDPSEELRFAFSANGLKDNLGTAKYNVVLAATSSWNTRRNYWQHRSRHAPLHFECFQNYWVCVVRLIHD